MDCTVTGSAKIQSLYFKDETKVLNIANQLVGSLNDGKIYTSNSNRDYNGDDGELNEIGEKYKGVANSNAEVGSESKWSLKGDEQLTFYNPKLYNNIYKTGNEIGFVKSENKYIFNDGSSSYSLSGQDRDDGGMHILGYTRESNGFITSMGKYHRFRYVRISI